MKLNGKLIASVLSSMIVCALVPDIAYSECVMRTSSVTKVVGKIDEISDIRPLLSTSFSNERKCSISARVLYKGTWSTIYSDYTGNPAIGDQELCVNAVELGVRQFLASKEAKQLHSDEQMVCSDEPEIKIRPVKNGDVIRQSEVTPDPGNLFTFKYKGTDCRRFVESSSAGNRTDAVYEWHGVICRLGRVTADEWTVVDKF